MAEDLVFKVRDPIHGLIPFTEVEEVIINSPLVQRLRGIRQLAMAEYVYPGARHTRFEHSLGTMHVAGMLARQTDMSDEQVRLVRWAALLHDVGHGPFSHVSEQVLAYCSEVSGNFTEEIHEGITVGLIRRDPSLRLILSDTQIEAIAAIIGHPKNRRSVPIDIVSGSLDADKLDYLLRDSYYAGVKYGVYDIDHLINEATTVKVAPGLETLSFREDAIWAIEQLLLAKHHMTTQVYAHRVRLISDAMIVRGAKLAVDEDADMRRLFTFDDTEEFYHRWLEMNDDVLVRHIMACKSVSAKAMFADFAARRLHKLGARIDMQTMPFTAIVQFRGLGRDMKAVEAYLAESLKLAPWQVIINSRRSSDPAFKGSGMRLDANTIVVRAEGGEPKPFTDHDDVIDVRAKKEREFIEVYVPATLPCWGARRGYRQEQSERLRALFMKALTAVTKES